MQGSNLLQNNPPTTWLRNLCFSCCRMVKIANFTSRELKGSSPLLPPDESSRPKNRPLGVPPPSGARLQRGVGVARSPRARSSMWLASAVGSLNVARLGGVSLKPVVNGQVSSTEAPVEAGSLWAGTGAVIFTVRRAG